MQDVCGFACNARQYFDIAASGKFVRESDICLVNAGNFARADIPHFDGTPPICTWTVLDAGEPLKPVPYRLRMTMSSGFAGVRVAKEEHDTGRGPAKPSANATDRCARFPPPVSGGWPGSGGNARVRAPSLAQIDIVGQSEGGHLRIFNHYSLGLDECPDHSGRATSGSASMRTLVIRKVSVAFETAAGLHRAI
jgi:hypothetical protein